MMETMMSPAPAAPEEQPVPAAMEEPPGSLSWYIVWHTGKKALLMSEDGSFMVYPDPTLRMTC